jgi:parallel beta-helix repeat protein
VVATASAFTGAYDPQVLHGAVPTGPGITTAQPFLPERDPARIFTDVAPFVPNGTLNPRLRAAAIPDPKSAVTLALGVKTGTTTDTARVVAGPAVCARLVEPARGRGLQAEPPSLALGTKSSAGRAKLMLVAVDRFGNPTDPAPGLTAKLTTDAPVAIEPDRDDAPASETVALTKSKGEKIMLTAATTGTGTLRVLVNGALCQTLAVGARTERNAGGADAVVALKGRADYRSVAAAAAGAVDRNGDGHVTITVADGVYRESVQIGRDVEILGAGTGRSVVDARGLGSALTLASPGALVSGLTASGGTNGVTVAVPMSVVGLDARGNVGAGITLAASGASASACVARENGAAGISLTAPATVTGNDVVDNAGAGIAASGVGAGVTITGNVLAMNGTEGIVILAGDGPVIIGNAIGGNFGTGIELEDTTGGVLADNRASGNDGEGLRLNQSDGALVDGNDFRANHGFGMRIDRSTADFDAAAGTQAPAGSNDVSDNRKGPIDVR